MAKGVHPVAKAHPALHRCRRVVETFARFFWRPESAHRFRPRFLRRYPLALQLLGAELQVELDFVVGVGSCVVVAVHGESEASQDARPDLAAPRPVALVGSVGRGHTLVGAGAPVRIPVTVSA